MNEQNEILLEIGKRMVEMTTTVQGIEEWPAIPELWRMCMEQRDRLLYAAQWKQTKDERPKPGQLIVKRWANGSVWAGVYSGTEKDSSFEEWFGLPA